MAAMAILPRAIGREEPLHLLVDSTGLKIYGEGGDPTGQRPPTGNSYTNASMTYAASPEGVHRSDLKGSTEFA